MKKLYGSRDLEDDDKLHELYCKHLLAMTSENLHSKSDIAAELAHRDLVIKSLKKITLNDRQIADLVNELTLTTVKYENCQCMRDAISRVVVRVLKK